MVKTYVCARGYKYIHTVTKRLLTVEKMCKADLTKNHILWSALWKTSSGKRSTLTEESHEMEEFGAAGELSQ